jgi:hypothetical protein
MVQDFRAAYTAFYAFQQLNSDVFAEIKSRVRMLACQYELEPEGIDHRLEADERYFYRLNTIAERYYESGKRFIRVLKQARKLFPGDQMKYEKLRAGILQRPGSLAAWLVQKIDEQYGLPPKSLIVYEREIAQWETKLT